MAFDDWSSVADENATTSGVNIAEGCPAANVNNWGRTIMAQLRAAFNPILSTFFASTTLAQARTALGVAEGSTSQTAFGALTNTANKLPYMTGSDAWALTTLTSFARTLLDDGDAATAQNTLGAIGIVASSIAASGGYVKLNIGGTTFILQWKDVSATGNTSTAVTYPTPFASWSRAWVNTKDTASDGDVQGNYAVAAGESTTGCTLYSSAGTRSCTLFAIGV